jgi:hypothetical protein
MAASLALVMALPAHAADDAPIIVRAGEQAPMSGILLPDVVAVEQAKRIRGCEAERDSLKAAVSVPVGLVVLGVVLGIAVGGAAGYAVASATR